MKRSVMAAVLILSSLLVLGSVYLPFTVNSKADLARVKLGLPLPFIFQNQGYDPPFPWQTSIRSVWENPTQILWPLFFLDVAMVFGAIDLVLKAFKAVFLRMSRR